MTTPLDIAKIISLGLAKVVVGAKVIYTTRDKGLGLNMAQCDEHEEMHIDEGNNEGEIIDVTRPLEGDCKLELLKFEASQGQEIFWHSSSHILGLT